MRVSRPNIVVSGMDVETFERMKERLNFLEAHYNVFEVDGMTRIEIFKPEW